MIITKLLLCNHYTINVMLIIIILKYNTATAIEMMIIIKLLASIHYIHDY